jgi:hypothetical protein
MTHSVREIPYYTLPKRVGLHWDLYETELAHQLEAGLEMPLAIGVTTSYLCKIIVLHLALRQKANEID